VEGRLRLWAWVIAGATVATFPAIAWLALRSGAPAGLDEDVDLFELLTVAIVTGTGMVVALARPHNSIGWLLLGVGAATAGTLMGEAYGLSALDASWDFARPALWIASWAWFPALVVPASLLLTRYPSGTPPTRRWRQLDRALAVGLGGMTVCLMFSLDGVEDFRDGLTNPFAVPLVSAAGLVVGAPLLLIGIPVCLVGTLVRWTRARPPERQQLLWLVVPATASIALNFSPVEVHEWVRLLSFTLVPVGVAIGILRYRLLDIEVIVRRGLVYGALTGLVMLVFALMTAVTRSGSEGAGTLAAAVIIATGLIPVRDRLQRRVDRLVYGDRREPLRALERLGREVEGAPLDTLVPTMLATVCESLRVPGCTVRTPDGVQTASYGASGSEDVSMPLTVGGLTIGRLALARSDRGETLTREQVRLLQVLAPLVAIVVRAAELAGELETAHERAVVARREERRRLRHDLHDALGPSLSGVALGLDAAQAQLGDRSPSTTELLSRLRAEVRGAVEEIRRLIDNLQPLPVEELGFVDAIREVATATSSRIDGLTVVVNAPTHPVHLPAPVEAAAYRIASEAVTNVVRHAGATLCRIDIAVVDGLLELTIHDDGPRGAVGGRVNGVGLASMHTRAEAVGGGVSIETGSGTSVRAWLPIDAEVGAS
jgi:signal transduction histidine kinase